MRVFNQNTRAARSYANELKKMAKNFERKVVMPMVAEVVADVVMMAAQTSPYNMGTLRGLFTATVNGSGALPKNPKAESIRKTAMANLKGAKLSDEIAIENQAPYAAIYEFGLFNPSSPKYSKFGGSEARHVPDGRKSEKLGKVLIVDGFNVTAPRGMVADAIQVASAKLAAGGYQLGKIV
jgi:hypothetical protein